ncbi:hypothetical protein Acr_00g0083360 [Actinidia rufa]|uniref:NB-ARC domain-containing disease resistance protein n=1 Tax=Actinidia rufa TaxID=165716 RepID=A0A7J0DV05_9ERIC|nr:hypothetical protein Acr_00g0083360 [Actinidia rufa]
MAEGVVGFLADGAVGFLLQKIDDLVGREWDLLKLIDSGVDNLRRDLESMNALLKDADAIGEQDHQFRVWVQHVRDLAYDIDNVLDMFTFHLAREQTNQGPKFLTRLGSSQWLTNFNARHLIGNQIKEINTKMDSIKPTKERYNAMLIPSSSQGSSSSNSHPGNYTFFAPRIASLYVEEADIVGIEEPMSKLISWALVQGRPTWKVMFVVGMGGSGKTALVKKVYESVKAEFDCHAWIPASRSKEKLELLWGIFNRLSCPTAEPTPLSSSPFNEVDLLDKLMNHLRGKRFDSVKGFELSKDISKLSNLQKLSFVKANKHLISNLGHLTRLRKLGIIDLSEAEGPILCKTIQVLQNLQSLNVTSLHKEAYLNLQDINNPPSLLQRLYLKGRLQKMPGWISKLHDLVRIRLKWSRLMHDPIPILQDLPNLLEFQLL